MDGYILMRLYQPKAKLSLEAILCFAALGKPIPASAIERRTGMAQKAVVKGLTELESKNLASKTNGKWVRAAIDPTQWRPTYTKLFRPSDTCPLSTKQIVVLSYRTFRPEVTLAEIARYTGINIKTVRAAMKKLQELSLLDKNGNAPEDFATELQAYFVRKNPVSLKAYIEANKAGAYAKIVNYLDEHATHYGYPYKRTFEELELQFMKLKYKQADCGALILHLVRSFQRHGGAGWEAMGWVLDKFPKMMSRAEADKDNPTWNSFPLFEYRVKALVRKQLPNLVDCQSYGRPTNINDHNWDNGTGKSGVAKYAEQRQNMNASYDAHLKEMRIKK